MKILRKITLSEKKSMYRDYLELVRWAKRSCAGALGHLDSALYPCHNYHDSDDIEALCKNLNPFIFFGKMLIEHFEVASSNEGLFYAKYFSEQDVCELFDTFIPEFWNNEKLSNIPIDQRFDVDWIMDIEVKSFKNDRNFTDKRVVMNDLIRHFFDVVNELVLNLKS